MQIGWQPRVLLCIAVVWASASRASTQSTAPEVAGNLQHADITFVLPEDRDANTIFRKRLIDFGAMRQLRNGPIGLSGGLLGSATYLVVIFGGCDGAIDQVLPMIEYAASNLPLRAAIVSSYRKTAKCVEKEGREEGE